MATEPDNRGTMEPCGNNASDAASLVLGVYAELRAVAGTYFRQHDRGTLQPTALVHEALIKLMTGPHGGTPAWENPAHFFASAAQAMRHVLVDHARARNTLKRRSNGSRVMLETLADPRGLSAIDVVDLDAAMSKLELFDERLAKLVEYRFFMGLSVSQAAELLGIGQTQAEESWRIARAWLTKELDGYGPDAREA